MSTIGVNIFSTLLVALMNILDCVTTVVGIAWFGAIEDNPLMAVLIQTNWLSFIVIKLVITVCVCIIFIQVNRLLGKMDNKQNKGFRFINIMSKVATFGLFIFGLVTVINNALVLTHSL